MMLRYEVVLMLLSLSLSLSLSLFISIFEWQKVTLSSPQRYALMGVKIVKWSGFIWRRWRRRLHQMSWLISRLKKYLYFFFWLTASNLRSCCLSCFINLPVNLAACFLYLPLSSRYLQEAHCCLPQIKREWNDQLDQPGDWTWSFFILFRPLPQSLTPVHIKILNYLSILLIWWQV